MPLENWLLFIATFSLVVAAPGPNTLAVTARALTGGARAAVPLALGMIVADLCYQLLAYLGLGGLAQRYDGAFTAIKWAGAAYLVWLGIQAWRRAGRDESEASTPPDDGRAGAFLTGLTMTLGNPKVLIFWAALLPLLIPPHDNQLPTAILLAALVTALLTLIYGGYILLAIRVRALLRRPAARLWFERAGATAMLLTGAAILRG